MSHFAGKWNDLILPIAGLGKGATAPTVATITGNIEGLRFGTGDYVFGAFEIQHNYKEGTDLYVHVHWSPDSTNTGNCVFEFEYSGSNVGATLPAAQTLTLTQAGSGVINQHQLANGATIIPGTGIKIGEIIIFRLLRSATGNTFTGNAFVHSIGVHYECDSLGSNQIATKN